jgi:hypothetical protein
MELPLLEVAVAVTGAAVHQDLVGLDLLLLDI